MLVCKNVHRFAIVLSNKYEACPSKCADWGNLTQSKPSLVFFSIYLSFPSCVVTLQLASLAYSRTMFAYIIEVSMSLAMILLALLSLLLIENVTCTSRPAKAFPRKFLQILCIPTIMICLSANQMHPLVQSSDEFFLPHQHSLRFHCSILVKNEESLIDIRAKFIVKPFLPTSPFIFLDVDAVHLSPCISPFILLLLLVELHDSYIAVAYHIIRLKRNMKNPNEACGVWNAKWRGLSLGYF